MVDKKPRVSIGMPVYNGDRFLEEALDSILAQTFKDFELIISDNGSTDRTHEICRAYATKDQRIRYYRNEQNLGGAWNFNRVFKLSTGEYFRWACHDDVCAPELLEQCVEILDCKSSVVLCYPKTIIIDEHGKQIKNYPDDLNLCFPTPHERFKHFHNRYRHGGWCNPLFGVMRASILKLTPLLGSYPSSDRILLAELALLGEYYEVPESLFFRRDHPQTTLRAYRTFKERMAWYDSAKKGQLHLSKWKCFFEYLATIRRVQMSWSEKVRCYFHMVKWFIWNWIGLVKDLIKAATWPFLKSFSNFGSDSQIKKSAPVRQLLKQEHLD
jgi:glycosyltransferase involved in cell wall biosynthesis